MNICFIANYTKTFFFHEIAQNIISKDKKSKIYWIVVNKDNYAFLKEHYGEDSLLYLSKNFVLSCPERPIGEFKVNELIFGDRVLKYDQELGRSFLLRMQEPVYNFVKKHRINYVFGESTWAHELMIHRIVSNCSELECKFLEAHIVRIPDGRFTFFQDECQVNMLVTDPDYASKPYPVDMYEPKKTDYHHVVNEAIIKMENSLAKKISKIKNYFTGKNLDPNDITLFTIKNTKRTTIPAKIEFNKQRYKRLKTLSVEQLKGKKFVLITLHKQPEASIDVLGRYVEDQQVNILNIWRQLPNDWLLVVKEHKIAVGDRPLRFYTDLMKYKNIVFVDEKADSGTLIDLSEAVVTISGTIAYEASLKHKKVLIFADVFFHFSYMKKITLEELKKANNLIELLDQIPDPNINDEELKRKIYHNSYVGMISDPLSDPGCVEPQNIDNVANAILLKLRQGATVS